MEKLHRIRVTMVQVGVMQDVINLRSTWSSAQMSDLCPSRTAGLFFFSPETHSYERKTGKWNRRANGGDGPELGASGNESLAVQGAAAGKPP